MGLSKQFRKKVAEELEMFTNQPLGRVLPLGDIGSIGISGKFNTDTDTTLTEKGIQVGPSQPGQPFAIKWQSSEDSAFELAIKASGDDLPNSVLAKAKAGMRIKFGKKGNYLFEAADAVIESIPDTGALHAALAAARKAKKIGMNDRIVMAVLKAKRARILMSEASDAEVELEASANFASIVDAGVEFTMKRQKGSVADIQFMGDQYATLFMTLIRVRIGGVISGRGALHGMAFKANVPDVPATVETLIPFLEDPELLLPGD